MKRKLALLLAVLMAIFVLAGCGSNYKSADLAAPEENGYFGWDSAVAEGTSQGYDDMIVEAPTEDVDMPMEAMPDTSGEAGIEEVPEDYDRKLIKNGSLELETTDFDNLINELETSISSHGGYIQNSSTSGNAERGNRFSTYTIRVPSSRYETFINAVGNMGTVIQSSEYVDDVTLEYIDVEARIAALTAERDSFMKLMDRAETVEEILQIQSYLTDVNYQIESYTTRLNSLKNQVSYSTVNLSISEVRRVTPAEPKTVGERISQNLDDNLYNIKEDAKDLFVGFVSSLPYLAIYAVIILIIVGIVIAAVKSHKRKTQMRLDAYRKSQMQPPTDSEQKK